MDEDKKEIYKRWKSLVNMSASEIQKFLDSEEGKTAGLSKKEASKLGIHRGRDSAKAIIRMKKTSVENWKNSDWKWCKRQISFISRMSKNPGPLYDEKGNKTRLMLSLMIWGHDPKKKLNECYFQIEELLNRLY